MSETITASDHDTPSGHGAPVSFDSSRAYRLHPKVALRPEPFGAMAYHYGNRRLNFLRHKDLVRVVESLDTYHSIDAALAGESIDPKRWPSFRKALSSLAASEFLEPAQ